MTILVLPLSFVICPRVLCHLSFDKGQGTSDKGQGTILTKNAAEKVDRLFERGNKGVDFLTGVVEIQTGASGGLGA
ncbi:MAG: hypothetical protein Fur0025_30480 [Oscillatoriaceae cyanobacterium]